MVEVFCGRIGMHAISTCAERAASAVADLAPVRCVVCLSPDGFVTVESIDQAIPEDIVGVYVWARAEITQLALWGLIDDDLITTVRQRGIRGGTAQRHYVRHRRTA